MPVHVEQLTSEVVVLDGDLPLSEEQLEKVADFVIRKLDQRTLDGKLAKDSTSVRTMAEPKPHGEGGC